MRPLLALLLVVACAVPPTATAPLRWDVVDATLAREETDRVGAAMTWRALRDDPARDAAERTFARLRLAGLGELGPFAETFASDPGHDPLAFLESLLATDRPFVVASDARDWPPPESFPWLVRLVDLDVPCASVHALRDSTLDVLSDDPIVLGHDDGRSTVGHEASYLLAGARHGLYPVSHESSTERPLDRDALVAWACGVSAASR